jgi:hypothetical protein
MGNLCTGLTESYYYHSRKGKVYVAYSAITAPVIYTTAAGTGGPLLWNGTGANGVNAVILGVSCALTVVSTVAAALGLTGNSSQTSAPTTTTAITTVASTRVGSPGPACTAYNVGTVANAGNFFFPLAGLGTGALTVANEEIGFIDLQGIFVVPPNSWISIAASATASTTVAQLGLMWMETELR